MKDKFINEVNTRYTHQGSSILIGKGMLNDEIISEASINIPLKMFNRHGLIAGATGTGKTKTLQVLLEQLSEQGIPSLVMDIKGDLSGIAALGESNEKIIERHLSLDITHEPKAFPVELLTISDEKGVRLRSTVTEFGPILFSKILGLNDTQQGIMSIVFKYCDDNGLPLVDLQDVKKVLQYLTDNEDGKAELKANYGAIAPSSLGTILRSIVSLEQENADKFFGELSFDVEDLIQSKDNLGVVNIIRLVDIQNKPNLFSTFILSLLAEIYNTFPEVGDADEPKLCIFIDEAHLIFKEASKVLLDQIDTVIKLIRSKGVGIYFITQIPGDVPESVLSQLGLKIQHALRGVTAKDKKEISKAVENYPLTDYYEADELIQQLGIGQAFVTALDERGIPTPLVQVCLRAPQSRMGILNDVEIDEIVSNSDLVKEYEDFIDKESAYEILTKKMEAVGEEVETETATSNKEKDEPSTMSTILNSPLARDLGRTFMREGTRMLFGMLGLKNKRGYR